MSSPEDKTRWWLSDAQQIADENPYTFHKPSPEAISLLNKGDRVKLIFQFDSSDPTHPNAERMWVEIRDCSGPMFHGVLDNDPYYIAGFEAGDPVEFEEKHIIQVSIDDPVPSTTDKYLPRCFVTRKVLADGAKVGYLYREKPDNEDDSGWRFMAGDESDEYMDDSENISWVSLGAVLREDDSVVGLLEAPAGRAFERDGESGEFVEIID